MQTSHKVDILSDLILINNDRYEGYKKAAEETTDPSLRELFTNYSNQSKKFNVELRNLFPEFRNQPDRSETTLSGKLHRVWMDIKAGVASEDRHSILSSCEFGEDVALGTYKEAFDEDLGNDLRMAIMSQKQEIQDAHNHIRTLRDIDKIK